MSRINQFIDKSCSTIISRTCSPKTRIIKAEDDWSYNKDNLQMQLEDSKVFRMEKFRICYGNFDEKGSGTGIIYQKQFDESNNQKYCIQEGQFNSYKIQSGKEYAGKSKNISRIINSKDKQRNYCKIIEIIRNKQPIQNSQVLRQTSDFKLIKQNPIKPIKAIKLNEQMSKTQQNSSQMTQSVMFSNINQQQDSLIDIRLEKDKFVELINKINNFLRPQQECIQQQLATKVLQMLVKVNKEISELFQSFQSQSQIAELKSDQESWTKYDQVISKKDLLILADDSRKWLNSSILDAYAVYLNKQNDEAFWQSKNKAQFRRTLIIPSFITTTFFQNPQYKVRDYFLEYEGIDYNIGRVYRDICFIINLNNFHWIFAKVDMELNQIQLYDSLYQGFEDSREIKIKLKLQQLFQSIYNKQKYDFKIESPKGICKQTNSYECGIYSCIYAKWVSEDNMQKPFCSNFEMRQILREIISPK